MSPEHRRRMEIVEFEINFYITHLATDVALAVSGNTWQYMAIPGNIANTSIYLSTCVCVSNSWKACSKANKDSKEEQTESGTKDTLHGLTSYMFGCEHEECLPRA